MRAVIDATLTTASRTAQVDSSGFERNLMTATMHGTWGASASVAIQCSPDGSSWVPCTDIDGGVLASGADISYTFRVLAPYIRFNLTNGDGATSVAVSLQY